MIFLLLSNPNRGFSHETHRCLEKKKMSLGLAKLNLLITVICIYAVWLPQWCSGCHARLVCGEVQV